jgi:hypothetical protein
MLRIGHCLDSGIVDLTRRPRSTPQKYFLVLIYVRGWDDPKVSSLNWGDLIPETSSTISWAPTSSWCYISTDALVSGSLWGPWPDFNFLWVTVTFFLLHVRHPLWREDGSVVSSANTHWLVWCRTHDHILLSHLRLPQPGGPGPCIYIPQEQGGPVIPPGTAYSTIFSKSRSRYHWQSVSMSWCRAPSGSHDHMFVTVWQLLSSLCGNALSDERSGLSLQYFVVCQYIHKYLHFRCLTYKFVYIHYIWDLSVRAQYSNLSPTNSSSRCHDSLRHLNGRTRDRRQV